MNASLSRGKESPVDNLTHTLQRIVEVEGVELSSGCEVVGSVGVISLLRAAGADFGQLAAAGRNEPFLAAAAAAGDEERVASRWERGMCGM